MPRKKHNIRITPRRRSKPDMHKLARAVLLLAEADAEKAAQSQHEGSGARPGAKGKP